MAVHRFHYTIGGKRGGMSPDAAHELARRVGRVDPSGPLAGRIDEHLLAATTEELEFSAADCELIARALLPPSQTDRQALVDELARVSHDTWMRQAHRDKHIPLEQLGAEVADHDRERAEDTVQRLERLGVL